MSGCIARIRQTADHKQQKYARATRPESET